MDKQKKTVDQLNAEILEASQPQDTFNADNFSEGGENIELSNEDN